MIRKERKNEKNPHSPCPGCGATDQVFIRYRPYSKAIQAYCRKCNFTMTLETDFPCSPDAIIEEWDRKAVLAAVDLKPCPFCGGEASIRNQGGQTYWAACPSCGVRMPPSNTWDQAIEKWNGRVPS